MGVVCRVEETTSQRYLEARATIVGGDVVVVVGGGEQPHIGCVVLAQPLPAKDGSATWSVSCSVLTIPPHKEEPIARAVAVKLASGLGRITVVTAGVHDDNIDAAGIASYLRLGEELAGSLVSRLAEAEAEGLGLDLGERLK